MNCKPGDMAFITDDSKTCLGFDVMFGDYDKEVAEVVAFLTVLQKAGR